MTNAISVDADTDIDDKEEGFCTGATKVNDAVFF